MRIINPTERQLGFCIAYLQTSQCFGDGVKAALIAGYSPKTSRVMATRNLQNKTVKRFMEFTLDELKKKLNLTLEWKLSTLQRVAVNNEEKTPKVTLDAIDMINRMDGDYAPEKTVDLSAMEAAKVALQESIERHKSDV